MRRRACVIAAQGVVQPGAKGSAAKPRTTTLIREVFEGALKQSGVAPTAVTALVGVPALGELRVLEAHYQATALGLFDLGSPGPVCRTVDTCGASPVTGLLEARRMVEVEGHDVVAVCAADVVGSLSSREFLDLAEVATVGDAPLERPKIVRGYDRVTAYQRDRFGLERKHARMAVVLESFHAAQHPASLLSRQGSSQYTLGDLEAAPSVTDLISIKECAWRADGAGCVLVAGSDVATRLGVPSLAIVGGGEGSGPLYPAATIDETHFGTDAAARTAYDDAGLRTADVDFFGLYDCFPICLLRAIEAAGLCDKGQAHAYIETMHDRLLNGDVDDNTFFPINTHGGLLCFGAPFTVPAIYNIVEAYDQLTAAAKGRQISNAKTAFVYGNGGIFSSSAVAILRHADAL